MSLAEMLSVGRDELYCDLAETYKILEWGELSALQLATLSFGLRDNSRIKMKICDAKADTNSLLLASIVDNTALSVWLNTSDGAKGRNRPHSVLDSILNPKEVDNSKEIMAFDSFEDFEKARREIIGE